MEDNNFIQAFGAASTLADKTDFAFWFIFGVSFASLVGITLFMIFCCFRYSRKRNPNPTNIHGSILLETLWTVIPTILVMFMFWFGWTGYRFSKVVPEGAFVINVTAQKWSWTFEYPRSDGETFKYTSVQNVRLDPKDFSTLMDEDIKIKQAMVVPINTPVRINLFSKDVVHSFFVPNFRVKADAMPKPEIDTPNYLWFEATKLGKFDFHCTEFCGVGHSQMSGVVKVVSKEDFKIWLKKESKFHKEEEERNPGFVIWKNNCISCHSNDGSEKMGPTFKKLLTRKRNVVNPDDSETKDVKADFEYIKESILHPNRKVVSGFPKTMPPQKLSDKEINDIYEYLKTIQD